MASWDGDSARRNEQLVTQLRDTSALRSPEVAEAFRSVGRHHFLPGRPLQEVYEDSAIMTKVGDHGAAVSSSSQPAIMAIMLEQLRPRPGQRVLEIGAGTGYNAALLAHLVDPGGGVTTLDIDQDLRDQAAANLAAAGVAGVDVRCTDGAMGWQGGAPYDRMIVTASTSDVSPSWRDQLAEGGRLVLPLALAGPVQQSVAFVRRGQTLVSDEVTCCGFMPLRGEMATRRAPPDEPLAAWLAGAGRTSGYVLSASDLGGASFEIWLALTANGYVRARLPDHESPVFGLADECGAALLLGQGKRQPIVVFAEGERAASQLVDAHRAWSRRRPPVNEVQMAAFPAGEEPPLTRSARVLRREHFTFFVTAP
jgi:protein-L-isoaspartate(D-aspartate) O-methyltransferase